MTTKATLRSTETMTLATEIALMIISRLRSYFVGIDFSQLRFENDNRSVGSLFDFDFRCQIGRPDLPGVINFGLQGTEGLGGAIRVDGHFRLQNGRQGYIGVFTFISTYLSSRP